ncbi:MAG: hypothetical protein V1809_16025 [Planctomycetota bacterium]
MNRVMLGLLAIVVSSLMFYGFFLVVGVVADALSKQGILEREVGFEWVVFFPVTLSFVAGGQWAVRVIQRGGILSNSRIVLMLMLGSCLPMTVVALIPLMFYVFWGMFWMVSGEVEIPVFWYFLNMLTCIGCWWIIWAANRYLMGSKMRIWR